MNVLRRAALDLALGLGVGIVAGAFAYEAVAILLFAAGFFSSQTLGVSLLIGAVAGVPAAPFYGLLRPSIPRAAVGTALVFTLVFIPYLVYMLTGVRGVFLTPMHAARTLGASFVYLVGGGALLGAAAAWSLARLPRFEPKPVPAGERARGERYSI